MNGSGSKLRTPLTDDDWFGISVKTSSAQIIDHSYPTHSLPGSLVQIVQIHLLQRYDNHNRESEFTYGTPPEVQTQMKNTLNLHEIPHPL